MSPRPYELEAIQRLTERGLDSQRRVAAVTRLRGGTKKGVYRLSFQQTGAGTVARHGAELSVILYVWSAEEDFWLATPDTDVGPFSHASGLDLFESSNHLLVALGVRTPRIMFVDRAAPETGSAVALVEDVGDRSLADLLTDDPAAAVEPLAQLREALDAMAEARSRAIGKIAQVGDDTALVTPALSCQEIVLARALDDLESAALELPALADRCDVLAQALSDGVAQIRPRRSHSVVHGELGPDHVLVDHDGRAFVIDIEGLMYFDVEWEHVFMKIRFPEHYEQLRPDNLDEQRMHLYQVACHLSLVAGPLRLLAGDFPDRELMQNIADWNLAEVLRLTN